MIMFWNQKEVYMGCSLEKFYETRQILEANQIKYKYKLAGTGNVSPFETRRAALGSFGENMKYSTTYYIYVHEKDFDFACGVLRSR